MRVEAIVVIQPCHIIGSTVAGHEQIQPAIIVVIAPGQRCIRKPRQSCAAVPEQRAAIIAIHLHHCAGAGHASGGEIQETIVVEIAPGHAALVHFGHAAYRFRDEAARAVVAIDDRIAIEARARGTREQKIHEPVVVIIAPRHRAAADALETDIAVREIAGPHRAG